MSIKPAEHMKPWLEVIQGAGTILALIAGAYWFFLQRGTTEQVKLEHTITQRPLDGYTGQTLITLDVRVTNAGKVRVKDLRDGVVEILQINPIGKESPLISFPLKSPILEPGEADQALFQTVRVTSSVKTIQVRSKYPVPGEQTLFWTFSSAADIGPEKSVRQSESQLSPTPTNLVSNSQEK